MNKAKIVIELVTILIAVSFISFAIGNNIGGLFGVSVAGAIIFWSVAGIWRELTGGKKLYLVKKDGKFRVEGR